MKKFLCLFSALTLVLISSCSSDDSSSDNSSSDDSILPKTISFSYPDFPSDNNENTITYKENKISTSIKDGSKNIFTYEGNLIVKQVEFDIDDSGNEVKDTEVSYVYENGKLKTKILSEEFSTENPDGAFINKTVYTHISNNQVSYIYYYVDPQTKIETKRSEGILNYKDGNLIKAENVSNDVKEIRTFEYDNKNNPLKNILGFNLLLDETDCGNNNVLKTTRTNSSFTSVAVYVKSYIYNDKGYPTKSTSYTSDGKTIEYESEYTY